MAYVTWRVPSGIYHEVVQLWRLAREEVETNGEWSDMHQVYIDQVKSLPGYPLHYQWEYDTLILEEVATPKSVVPSRPSLMEN